VANDLTNILPKILARGLMTIRQQVVMPRLVNSDYSTEAAQKGSVINVPIPAAKSASAVTPSNTPPAPASTTPSIVQIALDQWYHSDCHLTDAELKQVDENAQFLPMDAQESMKALANQVNSHLMGLYKKVPGYVGNWAGGSANSTPFASDVSGATGARKQLNVQLCPRDSRRGVVDFACEANMLALAAFRDVSQSQDNGIISDGNIGRKFGIDWYTDDAVPSHTAGTGTAYLINNGAGYAAGTTSIAVDTGSGTILEGDVLYFGSDPTNSAAVVSSTGGGTVTAIVLAAPGLRVAVANNATVTRALDHVVNMVFHRNAFAFATRPLATGMFTGGNQIMSMQDPQSGLVLRVEVMRQFKQTVWDFDILWGAACVRPELATRIAG